MKRKIRLLIILALIAAVIIGYAAYRKKQSRPEWRLASSSRGTIREEVTASGTLSPSSQVEVGTEVSGKIVKLYKDFNDAVRRGELLAKLDTDNLETNLEMARSDVSKAQINVREAKLDLDLQTELHDKGMSTAYELQKARNSHDQAVLNLANARASLKRSETNLHNAIITSPIDGVVISRNVEEGQTVAASMNAPTLFVIANNLQKMQIKADVDEADIGKIRVGQPVEFTVDAFADEQFEGAVQQVRLSPSSANNVVTYTAIIDVQNPQLKLLPGMTANVTIVIQSLENILRIPEAAIRFKPSKELWEQFGLRWEEQLARSSSARMQRGQMAGSNGQTAQIGPTGMNSTSSKPSAGIPDSLNAKPDKMKSEQRAEFRQKLRTEGSRPAPADQTGEPRTGRQRGDPGQGHPPANVAVTQSSDQSAPADATFAEIKPSRNRIWILSDGKPQPLEIVTGISDGTFIQVISGLKADQQFITGVTYKNSKQANATNGSAFRSGGFGPPR